MKRKFDHSIFDDPQCPKDVVYATIDSRGVVLAYTITQSPRFVGDPDFWVWGLELVHSADTTLEYITQIKGDFEIPAFEHSLIVKEKKMDKMPAVKCWDVVYINNAYYMVGEHEARLLLKLDNMIGVAGCGELPISEVMRNAERLYRRSSEGFNQLELLNIIGGCAQCYMIWKRPEVREMTVDQIGEALGYKVKVVGNDK